jgi:hypothetical protein
MESNLEIENKPDIVEIEIPPIEKNETVEQPKQKRKYEKRNKGEKTKKDSKKNDVSSESIENISSLMQAGFQIASLRFGEHWVISNDEAISVAKPLAKILDKYSLLSKAESVSDPVALIVATGAIVLPRVMVSAQNKQTKVEKVIRKNGGFDNGKSANTPTTSSSQKDETGSNAGNNTITDSSGVESEPSNANNIKAICFTVPQ